MSAVLLCLTLLVGCESAPAEETPPPPTSLAGLPAIATYEFELVEPGKPTKAEQKEAIDTWHEAYDAGLATLDSYGSIALMNPDRASFRIVRQGHNMKFCSSVAVSLVEVVSTDSMRITYESMSKVPSSCLAIGSIHADDLDIPLEVTQRPVYVELINAGEAPFVLTIRE
jgi:hypothetical protein